MNGSDQPQGNILSAYREAHCARLWACEIRDPVRARDWLRHFGEKVSCEHDAGDAPTRLNLGFTYQGLARLALDPSELAGFARAFREGMTRRGHLLGDREQARDRDPEWGDAPLHVLVSLHVELARLPERERQALSKLLHERGSRLRKLTVSARKRGAQALREQLASVLDRLETQLELNLRDNGLAVHAQQDLHRPLIGEPKAPPGARGEHAKSYGIEGFGFRDGLRNPRPRAEPQSRSEFVLDSVDPLLNRGSYLVVRKLEQDFAAFRKGMKQARASEPLKLPSQAKLGERAMGRERDGAPLDPAAVGRPDELPFVPGSAPSACPFASHVRRVNPQIEPHPAANPRLIRRGLSYLDADGRSGLLFMAFNADLEAQFEFIQKNWVQRGNQAGQLSCHYDPIAGSGPRSGASSALTQLSLNAGERELSLSLPQVVTFRDGGYFFVPSRAALRLIAAEPSAEGTRIPAHPRAAKLNAVAPNPLWAALAQAGSPAQQAALIQRWLDQAESGTRFWRYVRTLPGRELEVGPYLFIADPERVRAILADPGEHYSVREAMRRMRITSGEFFLGKDLHTPGYQRDVQTLAILAHGCSPEDVSESARAAAAQFCALRAALADPCSDEPLRFELGALLAFVLDAVVATHFGLPGPSSGSLASWGRDLARYQFRPIPDESDRARAIVASQAYRSHVMQRMAETETGAAPASTARLRCLVETIRAKLKQGLPDAIEVSDDDVARNLIGIVTGSLGATMKLFGEALRVYLSDCARPTGEVDWAPILASEAPFAQVLAPKLAKAERGGPDVLYRERCTPSDPPSASPKLAVLWLGGALREHPDTLFGAGRRACPGKQIGIAMLDGLFASLAEHAARIVGERDEPLIELDREPARKPRTERPGAARGPSSS